LQQRWQESAIQTELLGPGRNDIQWKIATNLLCEDDSDEAKNRGTCCPLISNENRQADDRKGPDLRIMWYQPGSPFWNLRHDCESGRKGRDGRTMWQKIPKDDKKEQESTYSNCWRRWHSWHLSSTLAVTE
jgi:hypothetical protein